MSCCRVLDRPAGSAIPDLTRPRTDGPDTQERWRSGPETVVLAADEVHVWRAALDAPGPAGWGWATLSPDERQRAARFHFDKDRERFAAGRAILRALLGRYLGVDPVALRFVYGPHGRPELAEPGPGRDLAFNLSHSQGLALYAVTRRRAVGVDLEQVRDGLEEERIAARVFSVEEQQVLRALAPEVRRRAFFDGWTCKEAYVKATGGGLSEPLAGIEVSLTPGAPAQLCRVAGDRHEAGQWTLRALSPAPQYAAALAIRGRGLRLSCFAW